MGCCSSPISIIKDLAIGIVVVLHFSNKFYDFFCLDMSLLTALQLLNKFLPLLSKKLLFLIGSHEHGGWEFRIPLSKRPPILRGHLVQLLKGEKLLLLRANGIDGGQSEVQSSHDEHMLHLS